MSSSPEISFNRSFDVEPGTVVEVAPGIRRILAPNPSPFTFKGTNTFILGRGSVAVVDPGPDDEEHRRAIERALESERLEAVIVTHTHRDHSPLATPLARAHGAATWGFGPHRPARAPREDEVARLDAGGDTTFDPDHPVADGAVIEGDGWKLEAIHTPGHTANHLCFAVAGTDVLLAGDNVMAWSTTIVAPPDGRMADYIASLERLAVRKDRILLPAHGDAVSDPQRFVRLLIAHRRQREASILRRIAEGDTTVRALVARIYRGLDPRLTAAAGMSVLAHLEDLVERGAIVCDGAPTLTSEYAAA